MLRKKANVCYEKEAWLVDKAAANHKGKERPRSRMAFTFTTVDSIWPCDGVSAQS